jgi:hypothetical protein
LERLTLTSSEDSSSDGRYALVTARLSAGDAIAIYQARLLWHWDGHHWRWDFAASQAGPFVPGSAAEWYKLSEIIEEARAY